MLAAISYVPIVHVPIGPLRISPHGVGIAVGFLLGARLMMPEAARKGITTDDVYALLTRAAIGSIIGARVAYVINHLGDYDSITEVLQVWRGGISLLGGFTGAILLAIPEMRRRHLDFWRAMDAAAPGMALGVIVGRIGDLIVADHLGKPTSFFLGYRCPSLDVDTASPCVAGPGGIVHQPHLYDLLLTIVLLAALLYLRSRPARYDGFLILVFGAWYGFNRFLEDFFRVDVTHGTGLTGSQWTAMVAFILCTYVLLARRRTPWWGHWSPASSPALDSTATEPSTEAPTITAPDDAPPEHAPSEHEEP